MKRIVLLPDTQVPYHDRKMVDSLVRFIREYRPDEIAHVGDFLDAPEPARWNKGYAAEFMPTFQAGIDEGVKVLERLREVHDGPFHLRWGNHDERVETYVNRYAPALRSLRELTVEALLDVQRLDITTHRQMYDLAPGWLLAHGHEGPMRNYAGGTAIALAEKTGKSVVCGHTHRAGVIGKSSGYNGKTTLQLTGMEVGHAMDMRRASYLKTGAGNWQQAFGILYVNDRQITPSLVYVHAGGRFNVEGKTYS